MLRVRIITGSARGARLKTPKGQQTRPTADRVKESVFNILGPMVRGRRVLDLFSGTGNLGLEAVSRGAASAVLVDQATGALMRKNAEHTHLAARVRVESGDVFSRLRAFAARGEQYDLVFCDPPYHIGLWQKALQCLDRGKVLARDGILIVEHGADEDELPELQGLVRVEHRRYGHTTQVSFFQWKDWLEEASS